MRELMVILILILGGIFAMPLHAQDSSGDAGNAVEKKEHKGKSFRLACWSDWAGGALYIGRPGKQGKGKMTKVSIYNMNLSQAYPYKSGEPVDFYQKTVDEEQPYVKVLSVKIAPEFKNPLVFLMLKKKGVDYVLYDLDEKEFPFGSLGFVNFTNRDLFGNVEGKKFKIKPKAKYSLKASTGGKNNKAVSCRLAVNNKGKAEQVYSAKLMVRPARRELIFFYAAKDEVGRTVIRSRSLSDYKKAPKKADR